MGEAQEARFAEIYGFLRLANSFIDVNRSISKDPEKHEKICDLVQFLPSSFSH